MPTINQLAQIQTLTGADQIPVYSASNGDARKASLTTLLDWIESSFVSPDFVTQYASPNVNGTNVAVSSTTAPTWLIITPTAPFAAMTITLPAAANLADGTELLVSCTQAVTTLTIALNGAVATVGAPATLQAGASFMLRYSAASSTWYATQSQGVAQGTFAPVATVTSAVGTTFGGRYTVVGNVVTLELAVNVANPGTFTFTTATDYFTGLPAAIQPTSQQQLALSAPIDGWQLGLAYDTGTSTWRMIFTKSGSPALTIAVPVPNSAGQYRWTVTYLL